jgi:hypothetical protein
MEKETRSFPTDLRIESVDPSKPTVKGYASVFNRLSEDLGGFREKIHPDAFNDVMGNDVRALFNHNPDKILARTKSGTLSIGIDSEGLRYEFTPPDTTTGRDLMESLKRGDIDQSSFGFSVVEDEWNDSEEIPIRTVLKVGRLYDVSPVTYPAYPDASVGLRSLDGFRKAHVPEKSPDYSLHLKRIQLMELES